MPTYFSVHIYTYMCIHVHTYTYSLCLSHTTGAQLTWGNKFSLISSMSKADALVAPKDPTATHLYKGDYVVEKATHQSRGTCVMQTRKNDVRQLTRNDIISEKWRAKSDTALSNVLCIYIKRSCIHNIYPYTFIPTRTRAHAHAHTHTYTYTHTLIPKHLLSSLLYNAFPSSSAKRTCNCNTIIAPPHTHMHHACRNPERPQYILAYVYINFNMHSYTHIYAYKHTYIYVYCDSKLPYIYIYCDGEHTRIFDFHSSHLYSRKDV